MQKQNAAFTLVELSIVLVILGLLIGGVLTGQTLIRAAELRSISTEHQRYLTATHTFRDKYFALPGDITNATRYWGRLNSNADCVTNSAAAVNAAGVCDGNGDGVVLWENGTGAGASTEAHAFWRHLATAGLIEGTYTGIAGSVGSASVVPGTNAPRGRISSAGWSAAGRNQGLGATYILPSGYGNYFTYGAVLGNNNSVNYVLKPEEAYNIDVKMDDGKPAAGKVITRYDPASTCTTSTSQTDLAGLYNLSGKVVDCSLFFPNAF